MTAVWTISYLDSASACALVPRTNPSTSGFATAVEEKNASVKNTAFRKIRIRTGKKRILADSYIGRQPTISDNKNINQRGVYSQLVTLRD